jgi:IS30 family transposase
MLLSQSLFRRQKRVVPLGRSIDDRPSEVNDRLEIGDWEIDLVVSGKEKGKAALLTFTERRTRKEIIRKLKDRTQASVIRAINDIERSLGKKRFQATFRSITSDNGSILVYLFFCSC